MAEAGSAGCAHHCMTLPTEEIAWRADLLTYVIAIKTQPVLVALLRCGVRIYLLVSHRQLVNIRQLLQTELHIIYVQYHRQTTSKGIPVPLVSRGGTL